MLDANVYKRFQVHQITLKLYYNQNYILKNPLYFLDQMGMIPSVLEDDSSVSRLYLIWEDISESQLAINSFNSRAYSFLSSSLTQNR